MRFGSEERRRGWLLFVGLRGCGWDASMHSVSAVETERAWRDGRAAFGAERTGRGSLDARHRLRDGQCDGDARRGAANATGTDDTATAAWSWRGTAAAARATGRCCGATSHAVAA
jgi:hypothetical protein